jgi:hypothetical protein
MTRVSAILEDAPTELSAEVEDETPVAVFVEDEPTPLSAELED